MGSAGKDAVRDAKGLASGQLTDYQNQAGAAKASVEKQKQAYKNINITNPYADVKNAYGDLQTDFENVYAGMENVYEDLTVNQQQAQFESQQGQQQRANIMQGLKGSAGGSGVAGLAQAMANQGQLQSQQASASIGMQESANQKLAAQGASNVQMMERQGAANVQQMEAGREQLIAQGQGQADLYRREGEAMVQQAETSRASTLLGMEYGELAGAQAGVQAAYGNQQSANAMELERINANKAMTGQIIGGALGGIGAVVGGGLAGAK